MTTNNIAKPDGNILSENLLSAALTYTDLGWPAFPIYAPVGKGCSCFKKNCRNIGKHPRTKHGLKDATTDPDQIREWFGNGPEKNLAIKTGPESGLFVLDVDGIIGRESLSKLVEKYGPLPVTASVRTGNGIHFYFKYPLEGLRCSAGKIGPGLDIRGAGGYCLAPPSKHKNGTRYEWQ